MCRLRDSRYQGFPGRASRPAGPALALTPPSSNRTCGFPASGFPVNSQPWPSGRAAPFGPFGPASVAKGRVFSRIRGLPQSALPSLLVACSQSRPLAPRELAASSLLWAGPTSDWGRKRLMFSSPSLGRAFARPPQRISQVPRPFCQSAPLPITPSRSPRAPVRCFRVDVRLRPLGKVGHDWTSVTRPNRIRLRCGSPFRLPRLRPFGLPLGPLVGYMLNVQLHGWYFSPSKKGQAYPGAPKTPIKDK